MDDSATMLHDPKHFNYWVHVSIFQFVIVTLFTKELKFCLAIEISIAANFKDLNEAN